MPTIEKTTEYAATPEAIWAAVSDFAAWPTWLTILKEWTNEPPRELSVGTTLEGAVTIMNIPMAVSWVIQSVDPPRGLAITGTAVLGSEVSLTTEVAPTEGGSAVTVRVGVANPMLIGALADSLMASIQRDIDASMENFRAVVAAAAS